jgi:hypothetical protein
MAGAIAPSSGISLNSTPVGDANHSVALPSSTIILQFWPNCTPANPLVRLASSVSKTLPKNYASFVYPLAGQA